MTISFAPESMVQSSPRLEAAFSRALDQILATPLRRSRGLRGEPQWTIPDDDDDGDDAAISARRTARSVGLLVGFVVDVTSSFEPDTSGREPYPSMDDDESYSLEVPAPGEGPVVGRLTAASAWGALRGLETLAQLATVAQSTVPPGLSTAKEAASIDGAALVLPSCPLTVQDSPRYPWRGLLLDTANHFLPVSQLLTFLDAMASVKMNVLHWWALHVGPVPIKMPCACTSLQALWVVFLSKQCSMSLIALFATLHRHIVDSYSFPFESASIPDLSAAGAWDASATYSPSSVSQVVEYAADRGVRVVPEVGQTTSRPCFNYHYNHMNRTSCPAFASSLPLLPVRHARPRLQLGAQHQAPPRDRELPDLRQRPGPRERHSFGPRRGAHLSNRGVGAGRRGRRLPRRLCAPRRR